MGQPLNSHNRLMYEQLILDIIRTKNVPLPFPVYEVKKMVVQRKRINFIALNAEKKRYYLWNANGKIMLTQRKFWQPTTPVQNTLPFLRNPSLNDLEIVYVLI